MFAIITALNTKAKTKAWKASLRVVQNSDCMTSIAFAAKEAPEPEDLFA
ncbi:MAG TPA: hypothetical protein VEQ63_05120 [Bryobacteraceae bacterium]|nr:hypothetical protein [Bryobacteraceae bacterium]